MYTIEGLSIGEITRRLNTEGVPARQAGRWGTSGGWGGLGTPAYCGVACFGKTRISARTRVMRPQRRRGTTTPSTTAGHQRPREEWIEIPVPALVTEESFARAQELLYQNKIRSRRRTIAPSVVQGLVSCAKCGYALSRTSTQTSARKIHYYKCIGSDSWRKLGGPVCDNGQFIRQELLDQIVWAEVIRLLEEPALIQQELDRRLVAARTSNPTQKREQSLQRELTHVGKGIERLLNAYQEGLLSIEQLRERMPCCGSASSPSVLSCRRSLTRATISLHSCAWPRPLQHSSPACAAPRKRLVSLSASASYGSWLKKFLWGMTPSPFATASPSLQGPRKMMAPSHGQTQITFCVRGVTTPPCGV